MAEQIKIADFDINLQAIAEETAEYRKRLDELKESLKQAKKSGKESAESIIRQEVVVKSLNEEYKKRLKVLQDSQDSKQQDIKREEVLTAALDKQGKSIRELRENNKALNQLKLDAPLGSKELDEINAKLDDNNAKLKDNADAYTKQKISIGDYQGSIERAIPGVGQLMAVLQGVNGSLVAQKTALQGATAGTTGLTKASKLLKIALISTGIGAIAVALGTLVSYLTTTQEGMDKVTAVTRPLQAVFQSLIGVAQNLGKFLFDAVTKPKKVIDDLLSSASGLATVFQGIVELDFGKIREGISQVAKETKEFFSDAIEAGTEVDRLTKEIERAEINIIKFRAETNKQIKEQENIAKNRNLTEAERTAAVKEQERLAMSLIKAENDIVALEIERLELKQAMNDTSREDEKELQSLYATQIENETRLTDIRRRNLGVVNQLQNEIAAERKKADDARLAAIEERKKKEEEEAKENLKAMQVDLEIYKITNKTKIDSEKELTQELIDEERRRADEILAQQLEILQERAEIENLTESEIRLEKLRLEDDFNNRVNSLQKQYNDQAVKLAEEKAKAMEQIAEAEKQANINAAVQTVDAVASVIDKQSGVGKTIALAKAGYSVYEAIAKANALGPPQSIPLIAQAGAIGFKAIKDIASVKIPSASGSGSVGGSGSSQAPSLPRSTGMQRNLIENDPTTVNNINNQVNMSGMSDQLSQAVARGAAEGIVSLSDNRRVQSINTF